MLHRVPPVTHGTLAGAECLQFPDRRWKGRCLVSAELSKQRILPPKHPSQPELPSDPMFKALQIRAIRPPFFFGRQ